MSWSDRERVGQLGEGQGIAARSRDERVAHAAGHVDAGPVGEKAAGRLRVDAADDEIRQVAALESPDVAVPGPEQQRDALVLDPPGHEEERRGRGVVEPVRVVDDREDRLLLGGLGQHAEGGEEDQEPVGIAAGRLAERRPQGVRLGLRHAVGAPHDRAEQPLEGGEGQRRLRLDPLGAEDGHPSGAGGRVGDQARLAHAGLAADDQCTARAGPRGVEQCGDARLLDVPALQHRGSLELHVVGSVPYPASGALRRRRVRQQGVTVVRSPPGRPRPRRNGGG